MNQPAHFYNPPPRFQELITYILGGKPPNPPNTENHIDSYIKFSGNHDNPTQHRSTRE